MIGEDEISEVAFMDGFIEGYETAERELTYEIERLREALQSTSTMIELMCKAFDLSPEDFVININASKENGETRVVRSISAQEVLDKVRVTLGEKE